MLSITSKFIPIIFLAIPITASAGIGESKWTFSSGEYDVKDFRASSEGGMYGCRIFVPEKVSFRLLYSHDTLKPVIDHGDEGSVTHISKNEILIEGVEKLNLTYPSGGAYFLLNQTVDEFMDNRVTGFSCDSGIAP